MGTFPLGENGCQGPPARDTSAPARASTRCQLSDMAEGNRTGARNNDTTRSDLRIVAAPEVHLWHIAMHSYALT
jgi:hypothetical protein